jgi:hypothetical protein
MKRTAIVSLVLLACLFVLGMFDAVFGSLITEIPGTILFGWIPFLANTLPKMSADWPAVWLGIASVALFPVTVHLLVRRWQSWKFRCSAALVSVVLLLFISAVAVVGMIHQVGWLIFSGRPVTVPGQRSVFVAAAARTQWINNLKQSAFSAHYHHSVHRCLPAGGTFTPDWQMLHSWETYLLPYLPYDTRTIDLKIAWNDPRNAHNFKGVIPEFVHPNLPAQLQLTADGFGASHLAANSWVLSANSSMKLQDITDGTSKTILFGGINLNFPPWGHPINWRDPSIGLNHSPHGFGGPPGSGGVDFAMVDGSIRFISDRVSPAVLRALSTPRGEEPLEPLADSDLDPSR